MNTTQLNQYILENAPGNICDPGIDGITTASSVDDLLRLYTANIDYVLSEGYPSKSDLLKYGGSALSNHGIYIDSTMSAAFHEKGFLVLLGSTIASVLCKGFSATEMYIKDNSTANVQVSNSAFVSIDVFDNATLTIHNAGIGRVLVNRYGNAVVQSSGQVKVVNKNRRNYE
jgi:hypothetical protein